MVFTNNILTSFIVDWWIAVDYIFFSYFKCLYHLYGYTLSFHDISNLCFTSFSWLVWLGVLITFKNQLVIFLWRTSAFHFIDFCTYLNNHSSFYFIGFNLLFLVSSAGIQDVFDFLFEHMYLKLYNFSWVHMFWYVIFSFSICSK